MEAQILSALAALNPFVALALASLGALVVIGQVVVVLTPSKSDDEAFEKIMGIPILGGFLRALAAFAPIQKK